MAVRQATAHIRLTEAKKSKIWTVLHEFGKSNLTLVSQSDKILSLDDLLTVVPHDAESPATPTPPTETLIVSPKKL